jgi:cytochrome c
MRHASANSGAVRRRSPDFFLAVLIVCWSTSWTGVAAQDNSNDAAQLMSHGFDCFSCHAIDKEVVGPAWVSVAIRYHHDPSRASYLSQKIRKGSVGDWGKVPMPAHGDVSQKLAMQLATYILSLKGSLQKESTRKYELKSTDGKVVTVDFPVFETAGNRKVVTDDIFGGFEKYDSYCFRCHGFDAVGGEYAPDLRQSLDNGMTRRQFFIVAMEGAQDKGMPGWAGFFTAEELNQVYEYVKARALDLIGPGRPPSKTD